MANQQGPTEGLERAREAVQRLSPDRLCLGGLLDLRGAAPDVVREVVSAIADALLGGALVKIVSAGIEALAGRSLRQLLMKWGIVRNETVECLKDIVNAARKASKYIDDERLRSTVEETAKKWDLDVDTFKRLVKTAAGKSITEDEVKKMIEEALEKIEEELDKVREKVSGLLAGVEVFFIDDFEDGLAYPTVRLVNGELMVLGKYGYHEVVRTGFFSTLTNKVKQRLGAGSLVVLTGPKGVGKSTLATVTIWELLRIGEAGMVLRIEELPDGEVVERFRSFIESFLVRDWEYFGNLIILYDPTGVYGQVGGVEAPSKLETTVRNVFEAVRRAIENAKSILGREPSARVGVLIILPTDLYNALSNDVKDKLESYRFDASLNDVEFLAKLIMEYTRTSDKPSGCKISDEELSKLAGKVAGFDSGHALIARLVGEELARSNCDVGKIEELISNAKDRAEAFIIQYINKLFKVDENPNTAKALVKIFALRRPFINWVRPDDPILTPGVAKLMGVSELSGWLAIRQHDLIEEAIEELLDCIVGKGEECKELGDALRPWVPRTVGLLREVSEKVSDVRNAVKYFASKYGEKFTDALKVFSNCWKRAALIIGHALAGDPIVPRPEDLPESLRGNVAKSLGDALNRCEIDDYLLVDNKIPPLIMNLIKDHACTLTKAFIDKYNEAVDEVKTVLGVARGRDKGVIYGAEVFYGLGLASIIAKAAELGRPIKPSDADAALRVASFAMLFIVSPDYVKPVLRALEPLRDYAPHRYLGLLASILNIESLDSNTVRYVFDELNEVLDKHGDVVKEHAWSLVHAIDAYTDLLRRYLVYFSYGEIENMVSRVVNLLNELGKFRTNLGVIAWADALAPALVHEYVRRRMEKELGINAVNKASEALEELRRLRERAQELMSDEEFKSYVESKYIKADEKAVRRPILDAVLILRHALAQYKLNNDELDKAEELFNEVAKEYREIGDYKNYLVNRGWALRVEAIKGSLVDDELVDKFKQLYEETLNAGHFILTAEYLGAASGTLGNYLVSLALMGDHEKINELLRTHWWVLNANKQFSVLTRLVLNALLNPRVELGSKLRGRLVVAPWELIEAFEGEIGNEFLPALMVAFGMVRLEDGREERKSINDSIKGMDCRYTISVAMNNDADVVRLRSCLINVFRELLIEKLGLLKGVGVDADKLLNIFNEFRGLVNGLDGKSLVQLIAPEDSGTRLAFMLYALINGNKELAKAHALIGAVETIGSKLLTRLLLEAYRACCDLNSEGFRRAIAKLFFYHV